MILIALALALAGAPTAPPAKTDSVVQNPDWAEKPNGDDLSDVYPERAQIEGIGGAARMQCGVTISGILINCRILEESPAGYGFGEAVLKLAPKFKMTPKRRDGVALASGEVIIPIHFQPPVDFDPEPGAGATFARPLE